MRKLYNEFFYIPKHGKIREKVMLVRVAMIITIMVMCLVAMSISAYAYFACNIASVSNIVKAADFNVAISIVDEQGNDVEVKTSDNKSHKAELKANKTYSIKLKYEEQSTAKTGFVIMTAAGCDKKYHTQQLGKDGEDNINEMEFKIKPNADTKVKFVAHWGTSSYYDAYKDNNEELYITDKKIVELSINGAVNPEQNEEETSTSTIDSTTSAEQSTTSETESMTQETTTAEETTVVSEPTDVTEPNTSQQTETSATNNDDQSNEQSQPEVTATEVSE